jgi:hypothetical protein
VSASEKLKSLPVAFDTSEQHSTAIVLMDALPQIVAVVEAAELMAEPSFDSNEVLLAALADLDKALS